MWHSALKDIAAISLHISRTQKPAVIKKVNINVPLNPLHIHSHKITVWNTRGLLHGKEIKMEIEEKV